MNARHFSMLISASLAGLGAPALVGCGSSFSTGPDGGEGDAASDGTSSSDGVSSDGTSSEGGTSDGGANSDASAMFQCADKVTSCQEGTTFCLFETDNGLTSCPSISTCTGATDPCVCAAAGSSMSLGAVCVTGADSHSPNECQVTCTRRKDAGSGSMDAAVPPPPADAGKPKDAGSILDVHIPDAHIVML